MNRQAVRPSLVGETYIANKRLSEQQMLQKNLYKNDRRKIMRKASLIQPQIIRVRQHKINENLLSMLKMTPLPSVTKDKSRTIRTTREQIIRRWEKCIDQSRSPALHELGLVHFIHTMNTHHGDDPNRGPKPEWAGWSVYWAELENTTMGTSACDCLTLPRALKHPACTR